MNIEKQIEFNQIKELWMGLAVTEWAKDTTDGKNLIEKLGTPPLQSVNGIKEIIGMAEKGDCLTPDQLERTERALAAMKRLKDYLGRGKAYGNSLAYYEENLNIIEDLGEEIGSQIRNGMVGDHASGHIWRIIIVPSATEGYAFR